jgi:hypothetical protein
MGYFQKKNGLIGHDFYHGVSAAFWGFACFAYVVGATAFFGFGVGCFAAFFTLKSWHNASL